MQINMNINTDKNTNIHQNEKANNQVRKNVVISEQAIPQEQSEQEKKDNPINGTSVHMTISKEGILLSKDMSGKVTSQEIPKVEEIEQPYLERLHELTDEELQQMGESDKKIMDDMAKTMAQMGSLTKPEENNLEEELKKLEEQQKKDYSKYVVTTDIVQEMSQKSAELAASSKEKQQDLEVIIETLGDGERKAAEDTEPTNDKTATGEEKGQQGNQILRDGSLLPDDKIESMKNIANMQASEVLDKAFKKEQKNNAYLKERNDNIAYHNEEILKANKEIVRIDKKVEEKKKEFTEEDFVEYQKEREIEKAPFAGEIKDHLKKIKEENKAVRDFKRVRRATQNMTIANRQVEDIQTNLNDAIKKEIMRDAVKEIDSNMSKVEKDYHVGKDKDEDKTIEDNQKQVEEEAREKEKERQEVDKKEKQDDESKKKSEQIG